MSKKHNKQGTQNHSVLNIGSDELAEYSIIKKDLIKVVVLSLIFFSLILGLYYGFHKNGQLENWFSTFLYF
ncbi:MAG: hypothetical protein COT92_00440 [Candidatus Doudnabacteria bacterium CG10_big_fil_rev_8_21_14_0_10_42_18]|uniref:Uncharacterized protein n=1 Tax=Candidatus Doudnabacteria bacterium CG10_big_fil_rev_8_21_14_0_10_42_18 TaxID=1974552 RepID=A0A2H0VBT2_9BACT|nr:MAG: hypothetical protein COT92_00440 [Candidatus Doudnabacteria bacterium CG10_big_fil_rev_8_21_14_0_10_42_18]